MFTHLNPSQPAAPQPKSYTHVIRPAYRGGNKNATGYEALIYEHPNYRPTGEGKLIWRTSAVLRRDVTTLVALELAQLRRAQPQMMIIRRNSDKRGQLPHPMLGRAVSDVTKAKISAAIKAHHEAGTFKGKLTGRPTNAQLREAAQRAADALGLTLVQYVNMKDRERTRTAAERKVAAAKYNLPVDVRGKRGPRSNMRKAILTKP